LGLVRKLLVLLAACAFVASACSGSGKGGDASPTPQPKTSIDPARIEDSAIDLGDVGGKWDVDPDAAPSTVQIGGQVGPSNVEDVEAQITTAYNEKEGSGYLSSSVFLVPSVEIAEAVMSVHDTATQTTSWHQERQDGGTYSFKRTGNVPDLPQLGDETYSATLKVVVTDAAGKKTDRKIEYIVFRLDRILAFVIAQDAKAGVYARRQEQRLSELVQ
jgi:hypothetical protein